MTIAISKEVIDMSSKPFTKHAQRILNKNPNVEKCTTAKVIFKEEFALKVCDALKKGEDPFQVFTDNGLSVRVLGKSRINGVIGLWKSKYSLEDLPRRKVVRKSKAPVETAKERKERILTSASRPSRKSTRAKAASSSRISASTTAIPMPSTTPTSRP